MGFYERGLLKRVTGWECELAVKGYVQLGVPDGLGCCSGHLTKCLSYQHMTPLRATIHTLHDDGSVLCI